MSHMLVKKYGGEHRLLLGIGIPLVGILLLWMLFPVSMSRAIDLSGHFRWHLSWLTLGIGAALGALMLLAGVGAVLLPSLRALLVVPLALLMGCVVGLNFFAVEPLLYLYRDDPIGYLLPVLVEAEIGAIIGLGVVKGIPLVQRTGARMQQQVKAELHAGPTQIFPSSAPALLARPQPSNGTASAQPKQPEALEQQSVGKTQDDIARVVAQMQQAYAQAAKLNEPNDGNPNRR